LNKEKAKSAQQATEITMLKKQLETASSKSSKPKSSAAPAKPAKGTSSDAQVKHFTGPQPNLSASQDSTVSLTVEEYESQLKALKLKLDKSTLRNQDLQEVNNKLKLDITRVKATLQREIGDDVDIETVLGKETWKGRAQQILLLKAKQKELQKQLDIEKAKLANIIASPDTNTIYLPAPQTQPQPVASSPRASGSNVKSVDEKSAELIEKMEKESKAEAIEIKKQLIVKNDEIKALKMKYDGVHARNKILEQQLAETKLKIT